jgi:hypothetical protein
MSLFKKKKQKEKRKPLVFCNRESSSQGSCGSSFLASESFSTSAVISLLKLAHKAPQELIAKLWELFLATY